MSSVNKITADIMVDMVLSGANNLLNNKNVLNDLNVFPVPDGDTGTNMALTISAAVKELKKYTPSTVSEVSDIVANASLRGARGNSGVILSQILRGVAKALKNVEEIDAEVLGRAFTMGAETAYRAVMKPTEGTILTVAREAAEAASAASIAGDKLLKVFEKGMEQSRTALANTPELLPQLKQAGVVDSGGQGLVYLIEGAYQALKTGKVIQHDETIEDVEEREKPMEFAADIKYAYCTEFIIQKADKNTSVATFKNSIEPKGDSMLVIDDGDVVKVHIHTNNPGYVLEQAIKVGSMINLKIDNMKYQHENLTVADMKSEQKEEIPHEKFAFVSVAMGDGIKDVLNDLGVSQIIEGGQTMNPSTEDVLTAIARVNADTVYVLPNNKNIILAAEQAKSISDQNVVIVPTTTVPEAVSALLAFNREGDAKSNLKAMNAAVKKVKTGQVTYAVRDTTIGKKKIKVGDIMGLEGKNIVATGSDPTAVCQDLLAGMVKKSTEIITVFYGEEVDEGMVEIFSDYLEETYPDCDIIFHNGGQPLYYYIVSVE